MRAQKRSRESTPELPLQEETNDDDSKLQEENQNATSTNITTSNTNDSDRNEEEDDREGSDESPPSSPGGTDMFVMVRLSEIRKEVQCPICLGIIRKTRTVMECLHRFCRECIDKAMRLGNNECPACRTHCASRRSLRDDPNYDSLIAALYPDIEKYEEEELAFHEEEKARNRQIQDSIAETFRRQTEALAKKRPPRAAALRSQGNTRNLRRRRSRRAAERQESDDEQDANPHDGSRDSSSADERSSEVKSKRRKRWAGGRSSPSLAADMGNGENDSELNRDPLISSAGLLGLVASSDVFTWGKGGIRSHNRHGALGNKKLPRNSRISKLINSLHRSDDNGGVLDINLMLVSLHEEGIPSLQRPYLCCKPSLSIKHLCEYVAMQTSMQPQNIEMLVIKDPPLTPIPSSSMTECRSFTIDASKNEVHSLQEDQLLADVQSENRSTHPNLVLAYRPKL